MKRKFSAVLCLCLSICLLSGCSVSQDALDEAWEDGYSSGYDVGFEDCIAIYEAFEENDGAAEYEDRYEDRYEEGYEEGYGEGYEEGYEEGYSDGHNDGYYAGATYTCIFFGDIERAFKCAKNGSAWYTLIDAYDQYEYDIYDDDDKETRSKLFWALVSYMSEDGATQKEYNLLYSAFSTDLRYLD